MTGTDEQTADQMGIMTMTDSVTITGKARITVGDYTRFYIETWATLADSMGYIYNTFNTVLVKPRQFLQAWQIAETIREIVNYSNRDGIETANPEIFTVLDAFLDVSVESVEFAGDIAILRVKFETTGYWGFEDDSIEPPLVIPAN